MTPRPVSACPDRGEDAAWRHLMGTLPKPRARSRPRSVPGILRAVFLDVSRTGPTEALVTGGKDPHVVTWAGGIWACDCLANAYHPDLDCKHILATRLRRGDRAAWAALREAVAA